jgi:hypothetical protein
MDSKLESIFDSIRGLSESELDAIIRFATYEHLATTSDPDLTVRLLDDLMDTAVDAATGPVCGYCGAENNHLQSKCPNVK